MIRRLTSGALTFCGLVLLVLSLAGFFPDLNQVLDNCSQLRLVYLYASMLLLAISLALRMRVSIVAFLLVLLINLSAVVPFYLSGNNSQSTKPVIRLLTINLWQQHNEQYDKAVAFVRQYDPDILCLNEIDTKWMETFGKGLPQYPYHIGYGASGASAIFSKVPITQQHAVGALQRYDVRCTVSVQAHEFLVIATHPPAPSTQEKWRRRNIEFVRLAKDIREADKDVVLIGDFNCTPWSPFFRKLVSDSGLIDSEYGHGIQPTWSTTMPLVLVPIDQCLTSKQLTAVVRKTGPNIGSDHLPLYVELGSLGR